MTATDSNTPRFDLDSYAANYNGRLRIDRLRAIGRSNSHLAPEALHLAIQDARKSMNVQGYIQLVADLKKIAPNDAQATIDAVWVSATTRRSAIETDRLESELKQYKNNLIKESIRMGNEDLGNHYFDMGDLMNAQKCYLRMRDSCTTPKQVVDMHLKLINVAVAQQNWSHALTFGVKMQSLGIKHEDKVAKFDPLINAVTGLAHLNLGHYKEAAVAFLSVGPSYMSSESLAGINIQKEIISPNEIAIYGGICALATLNSAELQKNVLGNQPFRQFLELESHLRKAISMFCSSKFSSCLHILESYTADYKLDLYLKDHFATLYQLIRTKGMVQWLSAYSRVTFQEIDTMFPTNPSVTGSRSHSQLAELEELIQSGALNARIDIASKVLVSAAPNQRMVIIENALKIAQSQERALRIKLNGIIMSNAGLEVKAPKSFVSSTFGQAMTSDGASFNNGGRKQEQPAAGGNFMV